MPLFSPAPTAQRVCMDDGRDGASDVTPTEAKPTSPTRRTPHPSLSTFTHIAASTKALTSYIARRRPCPPSPIMLQGKGAPTRAHDPRSDLRHNKLTTQGPVRLVGSSAPFEISTQPPFTLSFGSPGKGRKVGAVEVVKAQDSLRSDLAKSVGARLLDAAKGTGEE